MEGECARRCGVVGQSVQQNLDCSQIENEEEEEEEDWRRREGSSLKADVMQKVLELVVHERISQGEEVRSTKRKEESERMVY